MEVRQVEEATIVYASTSQLEVKSVYSESYWQVWGGKCLLMSNMVI